MTHLLVIVFLAVTPEGATRSRSSDTPDVAHPHPSTPVHCEGAAGQVAGLKILSVAETCDGASGLTIAVRSDDAREGGSTFVAARKLGGAEWTIVGTAPPAPPHRATSIAIHDPRVGGEPRELVALRLAADAARPPRIMTDGSLRRTAVAISPTCRLAALVRRAGHRSASIEVETIEREPAVEDQERDVRQAAAVGGRVAMDADDDVQLVVSPLSSNGRWVMHGGSAHHGRWEALAHLGTADLGRFERFVIIAIVSNPPLPAGHEIGPVEWASYRRSRIRAMSRQYIVRRTDPAVNSGIALQITHIREQPVVPGQTYYLGTATTIRGVLTGRKLSAHDAITIWVRPMSRDAVWLKVGPPARFQDADAWTIDGLVSYPIGQPLLLVAMLANSDVDLNRYQGGSSSLSPTIRVIAGDRPEVAISRIDGDPVDPRTEAAKLSPDAVIEGSCSGGQDGSSVDLRLVDKDGAASRVAHAPCAQSGSWRLHFRRPREVSAGSARLSADLVSAHDEAAGTASAELLATSSSIPVVLP